MQRKLTPEEYEAQALLLGLRYGPYSHTFYNVRKHTYLDADTLEPVSRKEFERRYNAAVRLTHPTILPWEVTD